MLGSLDERARVRQVLSGLHGRLWVLVVLVVAGPGAGPPVLAQSSTLDRAATLFRTGQYDPCIQAAADALAEGERDEQWYRLKIAAELARGKYAEAQATLAEAFPRYPSSVEVYLLGREVRRFNGGTAADEEAAFAEIERRITMAPRRYALPEQQIALGRLLLSRGANPRRVLDLFYDPSIQRDPQLISGYLASVELALSKQDFAMAAETLRKAPENAALDPRFHYLTALTYAEESGTRTAEAIEQALLINPNHVDSLLLKADHLLDSEREDDAGKVLEQILEIHPGEPRALAYQAVLAHLRGDRQAENDLREQALAHWPTNPEVDAILGRELARRYRFAESEIYLKRALELDPTYLPARVQLAQTLLRLGSEEEGWKRVEEIFKADGYNVTAFNLMNLRDRIRGYQNLEQDGIVIRMEPREASLYGDRVMDLLQRARKTLGQKYDVVLPNPLIVEIFPRKQEFAVRTFGLPGAEGFLGVCFGRVITANSPASQGENPSNWESVLWHELCHAITLTKTRNRMPRWLSEGISVYEEGQADPAWGRSISPPMRALFLGKDLTPLSQLSGAFLAPKSGMHLQFAYHESALAVEFLVKRAGMAGLKQILDDLADGKTINQAISNRTGLSLANLDQAFEQYARAKAEQVAPGATWEEVDLTADSALPALRKWVDDHPANFGARLLLAQKLVAEKQWDEARSLLNELRDQYPDYVGPDNPYLLLASLYRETNEPDRERAILEELARHDGDALPAYTRLMELAATQGDWGAVHENAKRYLAVNPLVALPFRFQAQAASEIGQRDEAIRAYRALAMLDETDPAEIHYQLARLLADAGRTDEARREVLRSLEEAPRFLESHRLLLELGPTRSDARDSQNPNNNNDNKPRETPP